MVDRYNPEKPFGMEPVAPMVKGIIALPKLGVDYSVSMENHHMRLANPAVIIGVSQYFKTHSIIVRE
jgi:hypothetical protein